MTHGNHQDWSPTLTRHRGERPPRDWLSDRGSLTKRIQSIGGFSVQVLKQGLAATALDEAANVPANRDQLAWVREVALLCDGTPVVFAHTILARKPRGPLIGWLSRLGERSLGALLFSRAVFTRGAIEYKRIDRRHELFSPATKAMQLPPNTRVLWARRSRFALGRQSVLVTEVFSPALSTERYPR